MSNQESIQKAREILKIIETKNFDDMEGAGMPEFGNYEETGCLAKEALSALAEPVCKGGDVISMIQSVSAGHTISLGEAKQRLSACQQQPEKTTCKICGKAVTDPDGIHTCQQPPAGEFVKWLKAIAAAIKYKPERDKLGDLEAEAVGQACDRIESLENIIAIAKETVKILQEDKDTLREQLAKRNKLLRTLFIDAQGDGIAKAYLEPKYKAFLGNEDFEECTK